MGDIAVMLFACDRWDYAERTIASLLDRVQTSDRLHLVIGDDSRGGPELGLEFAKRWQAHSANKAFGAWFHSVHQSWTGGRSYGANYNLATQTAHELADVILPLEDDWELLPDLNLDPLAAVLRDPDSGIDCIRLGYLGFTQSLRGELVHAGDGVYLLFDSDSPEPHVFAGHPRLESVAFERRVGPWPEGLRAGATEFEVAHRPEARRGVAWPMALLQGQTFAHIGTLKADPAPGDADAAD